MAIEPSPTVKAIGPKPVGEILWLAVTVVEFVVIMGIVCLPLSAELSPRLATGAAPGDRSGDRSVSVVPAANATADAAPSPTYSINRLPLPDASQPSVDPAVAVEGSSADGLTLSLGAQGRSSGAQPPPRDIGGPAPAARRPQQARSDAATRKTPALPSRPAPTLTPPTLSNP
jgi:hypothetical protein